VGASNIGWRLAGLAGCTTSAFAARPFTAGSLVARRWFAAFAFLTWLIVIPIVKVTPIPGMVLADLLATLGALFGALVMTYLPASTAYFRRANRRAAEGLGRA
jgi:hypothetical protein